MTDLHWEQAGEGPPVVLVHEAIADSRMWDPQWESFPAKHRTIRFDQRGYGRSPLEPGVFSHARDLIALLDEVGVDRSSLVGGSLGGRVVLEVAVAAPDRVEKLVLLNTGLPGHEWSEKVRAAWAEEEAAWERGDADAFVEVNLRTWFDGPGRSATDVDPELRRKVGEMQRRAFELWFALGDDVQEEPLVPDLADRLGDVRAPTLIVTGDEDNEDIHVIAERLERGIPDARRATIAHAAHVANLEQPEEFDRVVLAFLE